MPQGMPVPMQPGAPMPGFIPGMPMPGYPPGAMMPGYPYPMGPGYPAVVPIFVAVPTAAPIDPSRAAAQAARASTASPEALEALERATRHLTDASKDDALTLTQDVSESSTGLEVADDDDAGDESTASGRAFKLDVADFDDAAARLETIDGEAAPEVAVPAGEHPVEGGLFESISKDAAPEPERPAPAESIAGGLAIDSTERARPAPADKYYLVREGLRGRGYTLGDLDDMIRRGRVQTTDTVRLGSTQRSLVIAEIPALRDAIKHAPPPGTIVDPASAAPKKSWLGTAIVVGIAVAAFAAAGWYVLTLGG
jgi:hypothetical protein